MFLPRLAVVVVATLAIAACAASGAPTQQALASPSTAPTVAITPDSRTSPPSAQPSPAIAKATAIPGAPDSGVVVELSTDGWGFSLTNINAPAGKVWHIHIVRTGGNFPPNTFTVATGPTSADWIFHSPYLTNGEVTYDIPALPAGDYVFYCTVDPVGMRGTVTVR